MKIRLENDFYWNLISKLFQFHWDLLEWITMTWDYNSILKSSNKAHAEIIICEAHSPSDFCSCAYFVKNSISKISVNNSGFASI